MDIGIVFISAVYLTYLLTQQRNEMERADKKSTFFYYLIDNCLLVFLQPLALVLTFYFLVVVFLNFFADYVSTKHLVQMEELFLTIKARLGPLKDPQNVLRVLEVLFILGVFGFPMLLSRRVFDLASAYRREIKRVYAVAVLLCSFTLLGAELGETAPTLTVQIAKNRENYGVLKKALAPSLTAEAARAAIVRGTSAPQLVRRSYLAASVARTVAGSSARQ